jgi:hypothetical protein
MILVYLELVLQMILVTIAVHQTILVVNRTIRSAVRQNFPADRV